MIAVVTDSSSQLPEELRARYKVWMVPLSVVVDGVAYREGVDLSTDEFYDALERGAAVSTSAPSPGELQVVYAQAAAGATGVLAVHVGSNTSATVSAARLATAKTPVPVEIVDTATALFGVACCVWATTWRRVCSGSPACGRSSVTGPYADVGIALFMPSP